MAKWIQPTHDNVKALWLRIRDGRFKSRNGVPKFQRAQGIHDPDEIYLSWPYGKDSVVRCILDDIPAFLPDEPQDHLRKVLKIIAKRELREPRPVDEFAECCGANMDDVRAVERIFSKKLERCVVDPSQRNSIIEAFREALQSHLLHGSRRDNVESR